MDDNQIIKLVDWFSAQWKKVELNDVHETRLANGVKLELFCRIGRYQALICLFLGPRMGLYVYALVINPDAKFYCDKLVASVASGESGLVLDLKELRNKILKDDPAKVCRIHLIDLYLKFQENPGHYEKIFEYESKRPGKQISVFSAGLPELGKKR